MQKFQTFFFVFKVKQFKLQHSLKFMTVYIKFTLSKVSQTYTSKTNMAKNEKIKATEIQIIVYKTKL